MQLFKFPNRLANVNKFQHADCKWKLNKKSCHVSNRKQINLEFFIYVHLQMTRSSFSRFILIYICSMMRIEQKQLDRGF